MLRRQVNFIAKFNPDPAIRAKATTISEDMEVLEVDTAREVTIENLTKAVGVAKNTLRKYLDYLETAFLIRRLARVDRDARPFQRAVAFKVYVTAPCLYAALFGPVETEDEAFPRLAETALVALWHASGKEGELVYASWRDGAIDLLALDPATGLPGRPGSLQPQVAGQHHQIATL